MTHTGLKIVNSSSQDDYKTISNGLLDYNIEKAKNPSFKPVLLTLRNQDEDVVGGLIADIYWGWLYVKVLWISSEFRKNGYGTKLLRKAEELAVESGCKNACLDTFSFQAPEFYLRHGYEVFGELEGFPQDFKRFYMKKKLVSA